MKVNEASLKLHELSLDAVWEKTYCKLDFLLQTHHFLMIIWELFESTDSLRSWKDLLLNVLTCSCPTLFNSTYWNPRQCGASCLASADELKASELQFCEECSFVRKEWLKRKSGNNTVLLLATTYVFIQNLTLCWLPNQNVFIVMFISHLLGEFYYGYLGIEEDF